MNIAFQGTATQLTHVFHVLFIKFQLIILYFLMFISENYTKTIQVNV